MTISECSNCHKTNVMNLRECECCGNLYCSDCITIKCVDCDGQ